MTVTRKDLNMIAATLNQQLLEYHDQYVILVDTYPDGIRVRECLAQAKAIWVTSENMYLAMLELNPNVDYIKWRAAVLKDVVTTPIPSRHFVDVFTGKVN